LLTHIDHDGKRFIGRSDEKISAFLELEKQVASAKRLHRLEVFVG
jgi:hypothetical protein